MDDAQLLEILKCDLELLGSTQDTYLTHLISVAKAEIKTEGITLSETVRDGQLVVMYAAYLYRKRAAENTAMPRMLRYALNNRLMKEKGATGNVT